MRTGRSRVLQAMLAVIALFVALPVLTGASALDSRAYTSTRYALELDGAVVGWLDNASGGNAVGEVVTQSPGTDYIQKKHLAGLKYEDIVLTVNPAMPKTLFDWIKSSMEGGYNRKNGAIIAMDYQNRELSRMAFTSALIDEVTFPAMDAASKDSAEIIVKLRAEQIKRKVSNGSASVKLPNTGKTKKTTASNYRLKIDGLEQTTSRVNKIDALTVKINVSEDGVGTSREHDLHSGRIEFPNLTVTAAESSSQPLYDWLDDFVIRGNNDDSKEKNGSLEILSTDLKEVLFTLNFQHLGLITVSSDINDQGASRNVQADMYVEKMELK